MEEIDEEHYLERPRKVIEGPPSKSDYQVERF